jgi:hypothetical protein
MADKYIATTGNDSTGAGTLLSPWKSLGKAATNCASGDVIHCAAGSYSFTGTTDNANDNVVNFFSLSVSGVTVKGYSSTPGDCDGTTNTPVTFLASGISSTYMIRTNGTTFQNIKFDGASLTGIYAFSAFSTTPLAKGCAFYNLKEGCNGGTTGYYDQCYIENCGTAGGTEAAESGLCDYCVFDGCPDCCIFQGRANHCLFINIAGTSSICKATDVMNCSFWNCTNAYLWFPFSTSRHIFRNNVLWNNSSTVALALSSFNIVENTACPSGTTFDSGTELNTKTLTANPFANSGATITDWATAWAAFAPNTTTGGGAVLRGAAAPIYQDIGAVQHQDAGGSAVIVVEED